MKTPLAEKLGLEIPLFAFTRSREVAAAVTRAGGMGMLGLIDKTLDHVRADLDWMDAKTAGKPYGVDVVMPAKYVGSDTGKAMDATAFEAMIPERHKHFVEHLMKKYEVPELPAGERAFHGLLAWTEERTRPQVEVALSHPIKLIANALGSPPKDIVDAAHAKGVKVAALTGTVEHARRHVANGVDVVVAVGTEAGGHCGEISTMVLVPEVVDAVAPVPVLAGGGIGTGRQMAAAIALGAQGVWTGSIWLTVEEADTIDAVRKKLYAATSADTVRSRALSGKPARQLKTAWSDEWADPKNPEPLPMPLQFMAMAEATTRIHRAAGIAGSKAFELVTSPVGQIVGTMNEARPVAVVVESFKRGFEQAAARILEVSGGDRTSR
jgi:NAD(P)H-dependent flavin oxidoreductase YrpB (nitropropane dioxygenase family)